MHSAASDGTGPPDEIYARAWVRGYDFASLTDHDYIVGSRRFPSSFDEIAWVTDAFNAREGFTTLHAFEWTTPPLPKGHGHRNVYFRGSRPVHTCGNRSGCPDTQSLWTGLKGEAAMAIPHHTSWTGTDWTHVKSDLQPQFEVVSVHGACERKGNLPIESRGDLDGMYAVDGLARGLRFGFVGGSDAHGLLFHHGIGRLRDPWAQGLTGVLIGPDAGDPRELLFDAIKARRTFATSGLRQPLTFRAGEVPMGKTGAVSRPVEIHFQAPGYDRLVVVRDGRDLTELRIDAGGTGKWVDKQVEPGKHTYYLRALAGQGEGFMGMAWASPVFIEVKAKE
jgi:hypothetical protein